MQTVFHTIFPDEIKMPPQSVQDLLNSYRERQKTGVIRLGYASGEQLHLLFKRGELLNSYLFAADRYEALTVERAEEHARSAGDAYAKSVTISPFGLLMGKILMQAPTETAPQKFYDYARLGEYLGTLGDRSKAALAYLEWSSAAGAIFFAPRAEPRFNFVSQDMVLDERGSYKALCEWKEQECAVTVFAPNLSVEAWQEFYLRSAFEKVCEGSLARFETLTGRALVDSLVRLLNVFTNRQNIDISITARKLTDNEFFSSPAKTLYAYRLLLSELVNHFSGVIGARLCSSTIRLIVKSLPRHEYETARKLELFPKGYFDE